MRFDTLAIHAGQRPDKAFGAVAVPIYQRSTFIYEDVGKNSGYDYSLGANPTRKVLEDTIAILEGGTAGFAFATGMAAETTVVHLLKAGDHVISSDDVYGGTYRLFQNVMTNIGMWIERYIVIIPSQISPRLFYQLAQGIYNPTITEAVITISLFAGMALLYAVFTRFFPIIPIWETAEEVEVSVEEEANEALQPAASQA